MILAMFMNTAINQPVKKFKLENSRDPNRAPFEKSKLGLSTVRGTCGPTY